MAFILRLVESPFDRIESAFRQRSGVSNKRERHAKVLCACLALNAAAIPVVRVKC